MGMTIRARIAEAIAGRPLEAPALPPPPAPVEVRTAEIVPEAEAAIAASEDVEVRALERTFADNPTQWLLEMFGGAANASGVTVTPINALGTAFGIGARNVSEDLASLPLIFYERTGEGEKGKRRATEHRLYTLLHDEPNEEMDAMQFVETMQLWAFLKHGAFAEVVRDGAGEAVALWPIFPDRVTHLRINGEHVFHVKLPPGQHTDDGRDYDLLSRDRIFHLRGLSLDGVKGLSRLQVHGETIALSIALEEHGARFFSQGATLGGVLEHPAKLGDDAHKRLKAAFEGRHQGLKKAHRWAILEEGMKLSAGKAASENKDSQWLEGRKFQLAEGARAARIPLHLIGDMSDAKWANIEHSGIDYTTHTIRPWAVRWERAIRRQILTPAEREKFFAEFLLDALARGDMKTRAETRSIEFRNGVINQDEWRASENRDPLPDGKGQMHFVPAELVPVSQAVDTRKAAAEAVGELVRAGYDPAEALVAVGLPPIKHLGLPPVTVQPPAGQAPRGGPPPRSGGPPPEGDDEDDDGEDGPDGRAALEAFRPLFEQVFQRLIHKETTALGKITKRAANLAGLDAGVREFYRDHEAGVREALEPAVRALARILGRTEDEARTYTTAAAGRHVRAGVAEVGAVALANPAAPAALVEKALGEWTKGRAGQLAAQETGHALEVFGTVTRRAAPAAAGVSPVSLSVHFPAQTIQVPPSPAPVIEVRAGDIHLPAPTVEVRAVQFPESLDVRLVDVPETVSESRQEVERRAGKIDATKTTTTTRPVK